jgi:metallophosphoesterase superfamily enzyme
MTISYLSKVVLRHDPVIVLKITDRRLAICSDIHLGLENEDIF